MRSWLMVPAFALVGMLTCAAAQTATVPYHAPDCAAPSTAADVELCNGLRAAVAAEGQLEIYRAQLFWTRVSIVVSAVAALATGCAALAAAWAARRAREAIEANRRPKLLIREMILTDITDRYLVIDSVIANAGDARATIVESFADIQSVAPNKWRPMQAKPGTNLFRAVSIEPGAEHKWSFQAAVGDGTLIALAYAEEIARAQDTAEHQALAAGLFLRGFIVYEDAFGIRRRTAFFRRLNSWTRRFWNPGPDHSDYEYAD